MPASNSRKKSSRKPRIDVRVVPQITFDVRRFKDKVIAHQTSESTDMKMMKSDITEDWVMLRCLNFLEIVPEQWLQTVDFRI